MESKCEKKPRRQNGRERVRGRMKEEKEEEEEEGRRDVEYVFFWFLFQRDEFS